MSPSWVSVKVNEIRDTIMLSMLKSMIHDMTTWCDVSMCVCLSMCVCMCVYVCVCVQAVIHVVFKKEHAITLKLNTCFRKKV